MKSNDEIWGLPYSNSLNSDKGYPKFFNRDSRIALFKDSLHRKKKNEW